MKTFENNANNPLTIETKTLSSPHEVGVAFEDFMHAFEGFKQANDERLQQIEKQVSADIVTVEKVERLNRTLDEQKQALDHYIIKQGRPALDVSSIPGGHQKSSPIFSHEHKQAFEHYIRHGEEQALRSLEVKAHAYGSGPDGGYLVPAKVETEIASRLATLSPIRSVASVRQVSGAVLKKPYSLSGPSTGWVGEESNRPQTNNAKLAELQFPTMEIYAMPAATSTLLDDAAVDVEQWIAAEVETAFAEQESAAFINGDGVNKPRGFLDYETVSEDNWAWGKLGHVATGVADGLPADAPTDLLIDLVYSLKAGYRQNSHWMMNRKTQSSLRKLKDENGNYLWQPPASIGQKASFMGFGLLEAEDMPDMEANASAIAFGDFARGYLIVDRLGIRILRDPYSTKPYVLFYTTKRVGGGVQDFDAIKLLKCSL